MPHRFSGVRDGGVPYWAHADHWPLSAGAFIEANNTGSRQISIVSNNHGVRAICELALATRACRLKRSEKWFNFRRCPRLIQQLALPNFSKLDPLFFSRGIYLRDLDRAHRVGTGGRLVFLASDCQILRVARVHANILVPGGARERSTSHNQTCD